MGIRSLIILATVCTVAIGGVAFAHQPDTPLLQLDTIGQDEATFLFTSSTEGSGGHNFDLLRCVGASCTPTVQVGNNVNSPYTDEGLTPETNYCWVVEEAHGQDNIQSNTVCATTTGFGGGEPDVTIFAEREGKSSILVTWLLPLTEKGNGFVFHYDILRSDDGGQNFILIGQQIRDVDREVVDHTNDYRVIYHYLDEDLQGGDEKLYKVLVRTSAGGGQGNIKYEVDSNTIKIPFRYSGYLIKADGYGIETTTSGTTQPPLMLGWIAWIFPNVFGVSNPIFTSMLNPQNEVFEIDIQPITLPSYNDEQCDQILDVQFKRNSDSGQSLEYTVTILQSGNATHQFTDSVHVSAKRVFNVQYFIPYEDQLITQFDQLSVQIDVNAQVGDPRSFELYGVDFYVPEDNGAC